jgi:hypothetical protein
MIPETHDWTGSLINLQASSAESSVNVRHAGKRPARHRGRRQ